jgi:hypothetical protein
MRREGRYGVWCDPRHEVKVTWGRDPEDRCPISQALYPRPSSSWGRDLLGLWTVGREIDPPPPIRPASRQASRCSWRTSRITAEFSGRARRQPRMSARPYFYESWSAREHFMGHGPLQRCVRRHDQGFLIGGFWKHSAMSTTPPPSCPQNLRKLARNVPLTITKAP